MNSKPKLVVMLSRFPYPLEKGDKLRAYYQIKELSTEFDITLIAVSTATVSQESYIKLAEFCSKIEIIRITKLSILWNLFCCLFTKKPFQVGYFYSFKGYLRIKQILKDVSPNYIYCQLVRSSEYMKDYHSCPKTLDYMDALSKGIERRITKAPWYAKWVFKTESKRLKLYERSIFDYFENKTIISEQDREFIHHPQKQSIISVPNGIDQHFFEVMSIKKEFDLVFVGNLSYQPNIEAVEFISEKILNHRKDLSCLISGATPSLFVQRLCRSSKQITLQGWTEDIREAYCKGKIFVAPMMIGTGMQNKLLEAMALGIPCITTSLANNAIKATDGFSIVVANTHDEFNLAIDKLLNNPEFYNLIGNEGKLFVKNNYSWKMACASLKNILMNEHINN